jgi:hypothetical protein
MMLLPRITMLPADRSTSTNEPASGLVSGERRRGDCHCINQNHGMNGMKTER